MTREELSQGTDDAVNETAGHGELDLDDEALELEIASSQSDSQRDDKGDEPEVEVDGDTDEEAEESEIELDDEDDEEETESVDDADDEEELEEDAEANEPARFETISQLSADDDIQYQIEYHDEQRKQAEFILGNAENADASFLKDIGLKHFPYTSGGKSINVYTLDDVEFDSFIDKLEEHESIRKADVREVVKARAKYQAHIERTRQEAESFFGQVDTQEWSLISQRAPEFVAKNEDAIADIIKKKLEKDSIAAKRAKTFKGKLYLLNQAIKELKLGKKQKQEKPKRPKPATSSVRSRGKTPRSEAPLQHRTREEFTRWLNSLDPEESLSDKHNAYIARASKKFAKKK